VNLFLYSAGLQKDVDTLDKKLGYIFAYHHTAFALFMQVLLGNFGAAVAEWSSLLSVLVHKRDMREYVVFVIINSEEKEKDLRIFMEGMSCLTKCIRLSVKTNKDLSNNVMCDIGKI
jgi:hypothetical protein